MIGFVGIMSREAFERESWVLAEAKAVMSDSGEGENLRNPIFKNVVDEYEKLLRQSRRLVTMGDRMQRSLNALNHNLAVSEKKYRSIFESVTEGIYRCDPDGIFVEVNPAMARMFGYADPEVFLSSTPDFKTLFCDVKDYRKYEGLLASNDVCRYEARVGERHGAKLWVEISANLMQQEGRGAPDGVVGVIADVTERKKMTEEMCRLARTDSLTSLWNRGYFMELASRELARTKRCGGALSLLIVDADYFKSINDTYGHDLGDKALVSLSSVLKASVREIDVVGRFGGEEFVVLLPEANRSDASRVGERILKGVRQSAVGGSDADISLTVSIGLTSYEEERDNLDGLVKYADIALYGAKKNGRDRLEVYRRSPSRLCATNESHAKEARS